MSVGEVTLSPEESHHVTGVRRLKTGDRIILFDGIGAEGSGVIIETGKRSIRVEVSSVERVESKLSIHLALAVAMPKGSRQDVLVEKCTELGVAVIKPMYCEHSVVKPTSGRLSKWRRTALEACKQSHRAWLPRILEPLAFKDIVSLASDYDVAFMTDRGGDSACKTLIRKDQKVLILVGPEGGFSQEEFSLAREAGVGMMRLAPTILRTETAAIAAVALLQGIVESGER